MIERHAEFYGSVPEQVACDGGYASKANLSEAKALGVNDMVFHKKQGLKRWIWRPRRGSTVG